ncbi:MAG: fibronectin type III domain-containing protein [Bacteroidales bacterium]|nr:fibronectin type III domain-containing protein [Bacteroidales bacterium]
MKRFYIILSLICFSFLSYAQDGVSVPVNLHEEDIDDYSAVLSWSGGEGIFKYIISYNAAMSENIVVTETFDTSVYIDNLIAATQYLWKVRAVDVNMDTSEWTNIHSFYTNGVTTDCNSVDNLIVSAEEGGKLLIQWTGDEENLYWEIVCDEIGTNPDDIGRRFFTNEMEYAIEDLEVGRYYQIAVRTHCTTSFGNWKYVYVKYTSSGNIPELPLEFTLENSANDYIGLVCSNTNPWVIGTLQDISQDSSASVLFISNDNAQSATFNNAKKSISYAYIDFLLSDEAVGFYLDFSFNSNLVSSADGMKVFLVSNNSNLDIDSIITDAYQVGSPVYNNTHGEWIDEHIDFGNQFAGSPRKLVFAWVNTDTCSSNASVMIDNIRIIPRYCHIPDSISVTSVTDNSAELSWNLYNNQESFNIQYKKTTDTLWTEIKDVYNHYILENLEENTSYFFRVQANCDDDISFYSDMYSFTTDIYLLPVDKATVTYEPDYNSVRIDWEKLENIKYYIVRYKENSSNAEWMQQETDINSCVLSGLSPNTEYVFSIKYVTMQNKESRYTDEIVFSTICASVVDYPYIVQEEITYDIHEYFTNLPTCYDTSVSALITPVFNISELETAELSFELMSDENVRIYVSKDGGITYNYAWTIQSDRISSESYTCLSFILSDYSKENKIRIKFVFNSAGRQEQTARIKNISVKSACVAPRSMEIEESGENYIAVSWNQDDMATSWIAKAYDSKDNLVKSIVTAEPRCVFTNLLKASVYKISVRSYCSETESYDSSYTYATTYDPNGGECRPPVDFKAYWYKTKGEETVLVRWNAVADEKIWEVWYKDLYAFEWDRRIVTLNPQFSLRNLEQGDTYVIKVRTVCAPGDTSDFTQTDTVYVGNSGLISADEEQISVSIYPNPVKDMLYLETDGGVIHNLSVMTADGKEVKYYEDFISPADMSSFADGVYILKGYINGRRFTKTIIKR